MKNIVIAVISAAIGSGVCFAQQAPAPVQQPQTQQAPAPVQQPQTTQQTPASVQQPQTQQAPSEIKKEVPARKNEMKAGKKARIRRFEGKVDSVDAVNGKIVVKDMHKKDVMHTFAIGADVKIMTKDKALALSDITPGQKVKIFYEGKMDAAVVKEIKVRKAEEKKEHHKKEVKEISKVEMPANLPQGK